MNASDKSIYNKTMNLNLEEIKNKFLSKKSNLWKLRNSVDKIENQYRQFLFLAGTAPSKVVPWSQDVDDFWHEHILNTRKYEKDCQELFGKFIHHDPNLPKGTTNHTLAFEQTKILYRETFQEQIKSSKKKKKLYQMYNERSNNDSQEPTFIPVFVGCASCGSSNQEKSHESTSQANSETHQASAEPAGKGAWESVTDFISDTFSGSSDSSSSGGSSCPSSSCSSSSCSSSSCSSSSCSSSSCSSSSCSSSSCSSSSCSSSSCGGGGGCSS